jgi:hypothetical protein
MRMYVCLLEVLKIITLTLSITGYRSVQLKNGFNDPMELSSLLIKIDLPYVDPTAESDYQPRQDLRDKHRELANQRDDLIKQITHKEQNNEDATEVCLFVCMFVCMYVCLFFVGCRSWTFRL